MHTKFGEAMVSWGKAINFNKNVNAKFVEGVEADADADAVADMGTDANANANTWVSSIPLSSI